MDVTVCAAATRFTAAVESANTAAPAGFAATTARASLTRHQSRCTHPGCADAARQAREVWAMRAGEAL